MPFAALVVEDSLYGIRAAKAAGASCIGLVGTMTRDELEGVADAVIDGLGPGLFASVLEGA